MSPPMSDAAPAGEFLLEMRGINKSFPGVKALDNAQLKVRPHSVHALMGENGAGKSTLLKCLFGIYHADAGERHRFHHIACYRSGGTFPIGWNPPNRANPHRQREHASAMTDDRSARHSQHLSAVRARQRHRRLPRR